MAQPRRGRPDTCDEFLTVAQVAALLKLNQQTVRNWIAAASCQPFASAGEFGSFVATSTSCLIRAARQELKNTMRSAGTPRISGTDSPGLSRRGRAYRCESGAERPKAKPAHAGCVRDTETRPWQGAVLARSVRAVSYGRREQ